MLKTGTGFRSQKRKPGAKIDPLALYDAQGVVEVLAVSRQMVGKMVSQGRLPNIKTGGRYLWTGKQVLNAIGTAPHVQGPRSSSNQHQGGRARDNE